MNRKQLHEMDDMGGYLGKDVLDFTARKKTSHLFTVHINTEIREPAYYAKVFDMLMDASEEDVVQFLIASPGGRLDGLNILLEGIKLTEAHVQGILLGEASSAASILALNCHDIIPTESSEMLVHSVRFSSGGKGADITAHVLHTNKICEKLLRKTYHGYLTPEELDLVLAGKELFMDSDDIIRRLEARADYFTTMEEDIAKTERTSDVQPVERGSKSKKVKQTTPS